MQHSDFRFQIWGKDKFSEAFRILLQNHYNIAQTLVTMSSVSINSIVNSRGNQHFKI